VKTLATKDTEVTKNGASLVNVNGFFFLPRKSPAFAEASEGRRKTLKSYGHDDGFKVFAVANCQSPVASCQFFALAKSPQTIDNHTWISGPGS